MSKSLNNTKNNHFVPQFYLKSFLNSQGSLFMKDLRTDKIYEKKESDLKKVASEKNLYSIKDNISSSDIDVFEKIFSSKKVEQTSKNQIRQEFIFTLVSFLNDEMKNLFQIKVNSQQDIEDKINIFLKDKINNSGISRNQETLMTMYENDFLNVYKGILKNEKLPKLDDFKNGGSFQDFSLYVMAKISDLVYEQLSKKMVALTDIAYSAPTEKLQKNSYFDFLHYLVIQLLRTNKIINLPILKNPQFEEFTKNNNINTNNVMFLLLQYQSIKIAYGLINNGYKFVLVKNKSCLDFTTSDNPCVNTYYFIQNELKRLLERDEFEIYFPLSPKLAILYTKKDCYNESFEVINQNDTQFWNDVLKNCANRYIYSTSDKF